MSTTDPLLVQRARRSGEARRILEGVEATALGCEAQMLTETAEMLARTTRELKGSSPDEWFILEEAAAYPKKSPKAFEKVLARREIREHYPTERGVLFSRKELSKWLL